MTMLCIPLPSVNYVPQAMRLQPDLIELKRADHKVLRDTKGHVRFVDYDWQTPLPEVKNLILSYHNFEETPSDLEGLLKKLKAKSRAQYYKIATMAKSTLDCFRMLELAQKHSNVIGICMGEDGTPSRILAPLFGTPIMYASLSPEHATAPGQLTMQELIGVYHFRKLNKNTLIYAVIGDPVSQSPGHLYHNERLKGEGVYVKLRIRSEELSRFFTYVRHLPFKGLSVTIPHKVAVMDYLDVIDPEAKEIGAVNTIDIRDGKLIGYNTDALGALGALGEVSGKRVIVLGAGGAAQAIIHGLLKHHAHVTIINRTRAKAEELSKRFQCTVGSEEDLKGPYDILIQATSSDEVPVLQEGKVVMDISLKETPFLSAARKLGCHVIPGMEMYRIQAEAQRLKWFSL
ncbi:MAG: shikimate dehydrogenase [Verrucomicrobia bacterium]|nr:shikimate dehydrogenase [Verrucomicrobiota bacterium]